MTIPRLTGHKPTREARENKATQSELKAQNQKLRRENARLRRELQKRFNPEIIEEVVPTMAESTAPNATPVLADKCPECHSDKVNVVELGAKKFKVCADCKWRKSLT